MENALAQLMEKNLNLVWSERDAARRMKAIAGLYLADSSIFHVNHKTAGLESINNLVTTTLSDMPEDFVFTKLKPVVVNNDMGRLIWGGGPKGKPPVVTGMDIAVFESGKIKALYVFIDSPV